MVYIRTGHFDPDQQQIDVIVVNLVHVGHVSSFVLFSVLYNFLSRSYW